MKDGFEASTGPIRARTAVTLREIVLPERLGHRGCSRLKFGDPERRHEVLRRPVITTGFSCPSQTLIPCYEFGEKNLIMA